MWLVRILCSLEESFALSLVFEESADTVSSYEVSDDNHWAIEAIYYNHPDIDDLENQFYAMAIACGIKCPQINVDILPEKDWLSENQKSFPPIAVAGFFIHGSHIQPEIPEGHTVLLINAATAFGTGSHETTSGCLEAIHEISKHTQVKNPLDLGCGTAILAMATAKTFNCKVTAVDNDPEAIEVSKLNLERNSMSHMVNAFVNDGMQGQAIQSIAPFDLIVANILAGPLIEMAQSIVQNIEENGYLILSGILNTQAGSVKDPYFKHGMGLVDEFQRNDWTILIMQKAA